MTECDLCKLAKGNIITKFYYQDSVCIIVDCSTHRGTPMVVLKRHAPAPTPEEVRHIDAVVNHLLPGKRYRGTMVSIKDHWHQHLI